MNRRLWVFAICMAFAFISCHHKDPPRPNILFIMADDLGYGELGAYGQAKIETPHLDELAENGMRFTQFYTGSPVCAPSRCILLTGMHSGHSYIRGNDEMAERGDVWNYRAMAENPMLEGQRPLPDSILTLAENLKKAGYNTALFGKWGLGFPGSVSTPNKQGFDYFFGYNCQRQAHTLSPLHLWRNEDRVRLQNDTLPPRTGLDPGSDVYDEASYEKYMASDYAPEVIYRDLMKYVDQDHPSPFCIFWESPLPHLPLQAPKKWIDYYVEKFGNEEPYPGDKGYFPTRYPRSTYAAMISYLDENIGKVIAKLKEKGLYENTLIIFTSDNGPTYTGGADTEWFDSGGPFNAAYGWGKGFLREGGIRVPFLASWPKHIKPNSVTNHICSSQDIFPTLSELAGVVESPAVDGISFLSTLLGHSGQQQHPYLYWEFPEYGGQRAVRKNNLKAYVHDIHKGNDEIEVYDLDNDPGELKNIADNRPDFIKEARYIFSKEHSKSFNPRWQFQSIDSLIHE